MGSEVLQIVVPSLVILGYFGLIGLSFRALLAAAGTSLPRGWGTLVGVGMGTGLPVLTAAHWLRWDLRQAIIGLAAASAAILVAVLIAQRRRTGVEPGRRGTWAAMGELPDATDLAALVVGLVVLLPVLRFGATSWTIGANDGPNYFASAQIWLSGDGSGAAFLERHPDSFGEFQVARSVFEKPMVTSLYAAADVVSGVPAYRLLTPVLLVALVILAHALLRLLIRSFSLTLPWALACTVPPFMSVVFVSRLYDAQVGQVVAVALLAQVLLLSSMLADEPGPRPRALPVLVTGLAAAAALGANATVVLAASPSILAVCYWILRRGQVNPRHSAMRLGGVTAAAVAFSLPFVPWYLRSLALQVPGIPGLAIAEDSPFSGLFLQGSALGLPSPLAVVGLEPPHDPTVAASVAALMGWVVLALFVSALYYYAYRAGRRPSRTILGCLVVVVANGMAIVMLDGLGGYGLYKWMAVVIPLAVPLVLARCIAALGAAGVSPRWPARIAAGLVVVSTSLAVLGGWQIGIRGYVASPDLLALATDPALESAQHVNIDTGNWKDDSMAAVIVPSGSLTVTRRTYPPGTAPSGNVHLVDGDEAPGPSGRPAGTGGGSYLATERESPRLPFMIDFTSTATHDWVVAGDGYRPVGEGRVFTGEFSSIVVEGARTSGRGRSCIVIEGVPVADPDNVLQMHVRVDGVQQLVAEFSSAEQTRLAIPIPRGAPRDGSGRAVVEIETSAGYTRGSLGYPDRARSGFGIDRVTGGSARGSAGPDGPVACGGG